MYRRGVCESTKANTASAELALSVSVCTVVCLCTVAAILVPLPLPQVQEYAPSLLAPVCRSLIDTTPEVRAAAAETFGSLHSSLGEARTPGAPVSICTCVCVSVCLSVCLCVC